MKKQAYLILAHGSLEIFSVLIKTLDFKGNDIFVHIDKTTDEKNFIREGNKLKSSNIFFIEDRYKIRWGDFSIVQAELALLKSAISIGEYSYYHLISGVDFPIKDMETIYNYFSNSNFEFIQFWDRETQNKKYFQNRYRYYDFFIPKKRTNYKKLMYHLFRISSIFFQKIIGIYRNPKTEFKIGSQWFSITHNFATYLVSMENTIYKLYRNTLCSDESVVQTIIFKTPFYDNVYEKKQNNEYSSIKREIEFTHGKPRVWKKEDVPYLVNSDNFFARKFEDLDVIIEIKNELERS
ncbi:TPA: beta-1,6-N-acetylglucosaminyltransferase [Enterococcus faecium]|uniref:beta-1,6-N-acetylglucosaminyltransferase n=1 Tax=Enterococcus faecium TaxID=1352 RepID=UPI0003A297F5|nr:beta-1,6-N-acetylglucosaminyltransferase [Enterococcus faecium]ERK34539.1 hypothetical protein I131_11070 [Enterococcus faecium CRL1879]MBD9939846.1 hypothetical protein [Enterococcus faecium]MDQ8322712.1 beta-1,6-N-acetylglucosaminyltransferase [Enterococcus faecium]MDQ8330471.1 beta-1,6-N-acetylglucosaminyltransferase [Enterococcus faecium]MDT2372382.1 beta-1,6-N-acetylglucosaminyltransferase [Enterococcus faecium]